MTIVKKKDGRWEARPNMGYAPNGERIQRRKTFERKADAERWHMEQEARAGKVCALTVAEFWDVYYLPHAADRVRENTLAHYIADFDKHVRPTLGRMRLDDLRPIHIQRAIDATESWGGKRNLYKTMRQLLRRAHSWGMVADVATDGCDLPQHRREKIIIADAARLPEYLDAVRQYAPDILAGVCVSMMGARRSEVCALEWSDVTFMSDGTATVYIHASACEIKGERYINGTKTEKSERTLVVPAWLADVLHSALQPWGRVMPLSPDGFSHAWLRAIDAAGLPRVTLKNLRHTFGTYLASRSVPIEMIQQAMGHDLVTTTSAYYLQQTDTPFQVAANVMGELVQLPLDDAVCGH